MNATNKLSVFPKKFLITLCASLYIYKMAQFCCKFEDLYWKWLQKKQFYFSSPAELLNLPTDNTFNYLPSMYGLEKIYFLHSHVTVVYFRKWLISKIDIKILWNKYAISRPCCFWHFFSKFFFKVYITYPYA